MASDPVVYGAAIEGIHKALGRRFTPELAAELAKLGIDPNNLQVAYACGVWVQALRLIAEALARDVPPGEQYKELGRLFMRGFVQTPMGFAVLTASKLLGVRRTLLRLGRNFRTATNYIETEFTEVGPKELLIRMRVEDAFLPKMPTSSMMTLEYRQGLIEEVVNQVGAVGKVEMVQANTEKLDATFRVTWE